MRREQLCWEDSLSSPCVCGVVTLVSHRAISLLGIFVSLFFSPFAAGDFVARAQNNGKSTNHSASRTIADHVMHGLI